MILKSVGNWRARILRSTSWRRGGIGCLGKRKRAVRRKGKRKKSLGISVAHGVSRGKDFQNRAIRGARERYEIMIHIGAKGKKVGIPCS